MANEVDFVMMLFMYIHVLETVSSVVLRMVISGVRSRIIDASQLLSGSDDFLMFQHIRVWLTFVYDVDQIVR